MAEIRITLRSDLCAANGESSGSQVDIDICFDKHGIPFIPARRIKGCLRQAACELQQAGYEAASYENIVSLFGDSIGHAGNLSIGNAVLPGTVEMANYLHSSIPNELRDYATPDSIEKLFSYVRGSTALEDGVAKVNSLRYARVLRHFSPLHPQQETVLVAPIHLSNNNQETLDLLTSACKVLRHIGSRRNRGFGWIKTVFIPDTAPSSLPSLPEEQALSGQRVRIPYLIHLNSPVILPGCAETLDEIPARSVIGCMASSYLSLKQHTASDPLFEKLFLSGITQWSALTPVVDSIITKPAPLMLCYLSKSKTYYNRFSGSTTEKMKTIDGMFAAQTSNGYRLTRPSSSDQYHHSHGSANSEPTLYT